MIARLGAFCNRISEQIVPDPFVFALLLTLITMILGIMLTPSTPAAMVGYWMNGFWELLTFGMQMVLILVTGGVLAQSPPVRRLIESLARWPRSSATATMLVAFFAMAAALINWGLGLVVGALLAKETAKSLRERGIPHHYPLLGAAGYTGLMIWHGGLSGSAPLSVATPGHFLEKTIGLIPVSSTIFSPLNLAVSGAILAVTPWLLRAMLPRDRSKWIEMPPLREVSDLQAAPSSSVKLLRSLENTPILTILICLLGLGYLGYYFSHQGLSGLTLDSLNASFLFLGFLLFLRPIRYMRAVGQSVSGAAGIIIQFPFYAGIMGMMRHSGLVETFSNVLVNLSNAVTFPVYAFLSAAVVNQFVPSGGGQWAVQGPILVAAATRLHTPLPEAVMALAYGDQCTNMIQPFWVLPLLGLTGLEIKHVLGYTAALMILTAPIFIVGLMLL